jgi:hypothetical protein
MNNPFSTKELLRGQGIYARIEKLGHSAEWHEETAKMNFADADANDKKAIAEEEKAKTATNPVTQKFHASNASQLRAEAKYSRSFAQENLDRAKAIRQSGGKDDDAHHLLGNVKAGLQSVIHGIPEPRYQATGRYSPRQGTKPQATGGKVGAKAGHKFYGNQHVSG